MSRKKIKNYKRIIPIVKKCVICGKTVKNHHFLCDECWGKREKERYYKKQRKLMEPIIKKIIERNKN